MRPRTRPGAAWIWRPDDFDAGTLEADMKLLCMTGCAFVGLLAGSATAADHFRIDPDHTFAHFAVVHTGISSVRGRMGIRKGSATLDTENQTAEVSVDLDPRSIDTGVKRLDATLSDELFFNVARYKTARFVGHAVKFDGKVPSEFDGELTLHGSTRPVHLSAAHFVCKQVRIMVLDRFVCGGDLQAVLKRSDFGLDKYLPMVSDEVRLTISVEAIREDK
jgi:polyisoprenoid-binding protein YceI